MRRLEGYEEVAIWILEHSGKRSWCNGLEKGAQLECMKNKKDGMVKAGYGERRRGDKHRKLKSWGDYVGPWKSL